MNRKSFYIEPSGDRVDNPTREQVIALMREGDEEYWGPYSPVGMLEYDSPPVYRLLFIRHSRRGWYVQYEDFSEPKRSLVAVEPEGKREAWIEHWAEGDISYFLAACFIPLEAAEKIVSEFLDTCQPSPALTWEPLNGHIHWRELPPDDEDAIIETADPED